jgi:hypothetical protein
MALPLRDPQPAQTAPQRRPGPHPHRMRTTQGPSTTAADAHTTPGRRAAAPRRDRRSPHLTTTTTSNPPPRPSTAVTDARS